MTASHLHLAVLLALGLFLSPIASPVMLSSTSSDTTFIINVTGVPITVWASVDTFHKCAIIDVPDIPPRVYVDNTGLTHMVVGSTSFHRMVGPSPLNVTRECAVSWNETGNSDPAMFDGSEFLDSTYAFENGTVVALVHTEYPGNVFHNPAYPCTGPAYPHCWTVTIGMAVSHDWGQTWAHMRPPPTHLAFAVPYGYNQSQLAFGWGDPSNIIQSPIDGYYYTSFFNRNQVGLQAAGICFARTSSLMDPSAWRGWDGSAFSVVFADPYTLPPGTEAEHLCTVVSLPVCAPAGLVWSAYLKQFVLTLACDEQSGHAFFISTSPDIIHWTPPSIFYTSKDLPHNVSAMVTSMAYPTFVDLSAPTAFRDRNFATIGQFPQLFWVSIGHSPYTDGRRVWATPMAFSLAGEENGKNSLAAGDGDGADAHDLAPSLWEVE